MSKAIREQIDKLYAELEEITIPGNFILDPRIAVISNKIEALQNQCAHYYVNGVCKYCDSEVKE